jgi:cytochrome P450
MRPILSTPIAVIFSHAIAEQCSKPSKHFRYSLPKSYTIRSVHPIIGTESMLFREGEQWKPMRKRFNPGLRLSIWSRSSLLSWIGQRFLGRLDE